MTGTGDRGRFVQPAERVSARAIEGQVIVVELESDRVFELDPIGSHIWSLIEAGGAYEGELRAKLLSEFDVDEDRLRRELDSFLTELAGAGVIRVGEPADPDR